MQFPRLVSSDTHDGLMGRSPRHPNTDTRCFHGSKLHGWIRNMSHNSRSQRTTSEPVNSQRPKAPSASGFVSRTKHQIRGGGTFPPGHAFYRRFRTGHHGRDALQHDLQLPRGMGEREHVKYPVLSLPHGGKYGVPVSLLRARLFHTFHTLSSRTSIRMPIGQRTAHCMKSTSGPDVLFVLPNILGNGSHVQFGNMSHGPYSRKRLQT